MKRPSLFVWLVVGIAAGLPTGGRAMVSLLAQETATSAAVSSNTPYSDAKPIIEALQETLLPAALRAKTPAEREAAWPAWVSRRDADIRARVEEGEEDSVVHLLLFGTLFTKQPLVTENELVPLAGARADAPTPLQARIDDFMAAVASPGTNERLLFARQVLARHGIDPTTAAGKSEMRRYLEARIAEVGATAARSRQAILSDPSADSVDRRTLFRDRGLTFNTSVFINLAIEQALANIQAEGLMRPGSVRRVAIVGPGLEFTEKQDGYDFYAPQTIQPFAVIDAVVRLGLGTLKDLQVTVFDLSPRILQHLEAARTQARAGRPYSLVLPRNLDRPWTPSLVRSWEQFGDRIGEETRAVTPPADAGRVAVRSVLVRPSVVLATTPRDLDVVLQRLEPASADDQFDIILATNILIYYDVFEQSLAAANIAKMLRPGGVFLSNDRIFELPATPLGSVGYTDVTYVTLPGVGDAGDRIVWYQRQ